MADKTGYIGRNPGDSSVTIARQTFTPTSDTTEFTFTSGYTVGLCDVYLNGVKLVDARDYDANTGSTVGLTSAAVNGDIVEIIAYKAFNLGQVSSSSGNFTVGSNLSVGSTATLSGVTTCEGDLYVGGDLYVLDDIVYDEVSGRNLNITGIATAATIHVGSATTIDGSGINVTGVITATSFSGDGSALSGIGGTSDINTNNIQVSGITTLGSIRGDINIDGSAVGVTSVTWDASADSLIFKDNSKSIFGDSSDFQIYHNGTSSYIDNNTSHVYIRSNVDGDDGGNIYIQAKSGEDSIVCNDDGNVQLYYDNYNALQTNANGIKVQGPTGGAAILYLNADQGSDDADKFRFKAEDDGPLKIENDTSGSWETSIEINGNGNVELFYDNSKKIETTSTGVLVTGKVTATNYAGDGSALTGVGGEFDITSCLFI